MIVVGTKAWRNNEKGKGYQDIEVSSLLQMVGRAGRPGLDSTGVAVVLTDSCSKKRIEDLLEVGIGPANSNLVPRLPEVLNTEISQRVITSMEDTLLWLKTTFLFCCLKRNKNAISSMRKLCNDAIAHLTEIGVVETNELQSLCPLSGAFIMNRHLVSLEQMRSIASFPFDVSRSQILRCMSKLDSLQSFVKRNEKRELKEFHKSDLMKYKLPGTVSKFVVKDPSEKAFILLQSHISRHKYKNEMLNNEQIIVRNEAIKFLEVAQEYCVKASKHGKVAFECYMLQRSLNYSLWGESSGVFNQFDWIGSSKTASNDLLFNGIQSFQDVLDVSEQKLDKIFAQSKIVDLPKNAGRIVKHTACNLCRHRLQLSTDIDYTKNSKKPTDLICSLKFHTPTIITTREDREQNLKFSLIAYADSPVDSSLIFEENICSATSFRVPLPSHSFQKIYVHLVGTWVGFDQGKILNVMDSSVSSNKMNVTMLQSSPAAFLGVNALARTKKKQSHLAGSSYLTNQRHNEKGKHTADNEVKKPSPITPQPKDCNTEMYHPRITTNQQSLEAFCKESKETCQTIHPAMLPRTPSHHPVPYNQPQIDKRPDSINVTPTIYFPIKKTLRHGKSASDLNKNEFLPSGTNHGSSETTVFQECCGKTSCGDKLSTCALNLTVPTLARERRTQKPKRQRDQLTENQMIAHQATKTPRQSIHYSPMQNWRHNNPEKKKWSQSRTRQQRDQKRAFTEKKMNPFRTFSHDPNDFERLLEDLSQKSSIIPNPLLAKMKQSSIASNRKSQHHLLTDQSCQAWTVHYRHSNQNLQQVLREKAFEQQFQHEKTLSGQETVQNLMTSQDPQQGNHWQHSRESFQNPCREIGYQLPYPQIDKTQPHHPHNPIPSGTLHFPATEEGTGTYPPTLSSQYHQCNRTFGQNSSGRQFPQEPLEVQTFEEYHQQLHIDSYGNSGTKRDHQMQHQHLHVSHQSHNQLPHSPADFEINF